jgi:hypothetical protein
LAAKTDIQQLILENLAKLIADPTPRLMSGTARNPGIFTGNSQAVKNAARLCEDNGWLEKTGQISGKGAKAKPLYRLTAAGAQHVLANSKDLALLQASNNSLGETVAGCQKIQEQLQQVLLKVQQQQEITKALAQRLRPPDVSALVQSLKPVSPAPPQHATLPPVWLPQVLDYLREFKRRQPLADCPLPELYQQVAQPLGLSIGMFHDGLRQLVEQGKVRLHPFTGAAYQLQEGQYALVAGQEIKYYAEPLANT